MMLDRKGDHYIARALGISYETVCEIRKRLFAFMLQVPDDAVLP